MGFNFAGIVINKNYEGQLEELGQALGFNLTYDSEISYEEASRNGKEDGVCDIYFSKNGSLVFLPMELCIKDYFIKNQHVLTFAYSDTAMAFNLAYYEGTACKRKILEVTEHRITDSGDLLGEETLDTDVSELIFDQIGVLLGQDFWEMAPTLKATRYNMITESERGVKY